MKKILSKLTLIVILSLAAAKGYCGLPDPNIVFNEDSLRAIDCAFVNGQPQCNFANPPQDLPLTVCGDGKLDNNEQCDGDKVAECAISGSTCSSTCTCVPPSDNPPANSPENPSDNLPATVEPENPAPVLTASTPASPQTSATSQGITPIIEGRGCSLITQTGSTSSFNTLWIFGAGLIPAFVRRFKKETK